MCDLEEEHFEDYPNDHGEPAEKPSDLMQLLKALEYYADPKTYFAISILPDFPCGAFTEDFSETELGLKPGKLARETLKKYKSI